jgi:hypothetical protein
MSDRVSKEWSASADWIEFGVENVSKKYITIIDVKLFVYTTVKSFIVWPLEKKVLQSFVFK